MYTHSCRDTHALTHTDIHALTYIHTYWCTDTCTHACTYALTHTCTHSQTHMRTHTHTSTRTHTHSHTHTHSPIIIYADTILKIKFSRLKKKKNNLSKSKDWHDRFSYQSAIRGVLQGRPWVPGAQTLSCLRHNSTMYLAKQLKGASERHEGACPGPWAPLPPCGRVKSMQPTQTKDCSP